MKTFLFLLSLIVLAPRFSQAAESAESQPAEISEPAASVTNAVALPEDTIARINGHPIPYEWFLHAFRSSFFRYGEDASVRSRVYEQFLGQMLLHRAAVEDGVGDDPELQAKIAEQIAQTRSFMEYQLSMMEIGMAVEAYLAKHKMAPEDYEVTDEDLDAQMRKVAPPGTAENQSFDDLPAGAQKQLRNMALMEKRNQAVEKLIEKLWGEMQIEMNMPAVNAVPLPEIIRD